MSEGYIGYRKPIRQEREASQHEGNVSPNCRSGSAAARTRRSAEPCALRRSAPRPEDEPPGHRGVLLLRRFDRLAAGRLVVRVRPLCAGRLGAVDPSRIVQIQDRSLWWRPQSVRLSMTPVAFGGRRTGASSAPVDSCLAAWCGWRAARFRVPLARGDASCRGGRFVKVEEVLAQLPGEAVEDLRVGRASPTLAAQTAHAPLSFPNSEGTT